MDLEKRQVKKILGIVAFGIVLFWLLENLPFIGNIVGTIIAIIMPFIIGICVAFILNVPMNLLENKIFVSKKKKAKRKVKKVSKLKRITSLIISMLIVVGIIAIVLFLVIPELISAFGVMKSNIPGIMGDIVNWLREITANYPDISSQIQNIHIDWNTVGGEIWKFAQSGFTTILQSSISFLVSTVGIIVNVIIGLIFAIYILVQKEKLAFQLKKLVYAYCDKSKADKIMKIAKLSNKTFNDFISGQVVEACILGVLCFIGMLILQIPYAVAISVLIAVCALIPLLGAFIGTAIGVILIIATSPMKALIFVIFIIVLQQIEGNLIYPKVVGKSVGLPAIWVLVAITIGGSLLGLLGIILSVPICSILYVLIRENVHERLEEKNIKVT